MEVGGDAFEAGTILFDVELDCAVSVFDAQIDKEREQPISSEPIIVTWQHFSHAALVIRARGQVGAEQKRILRANKARELGEYPAWFGIGNHTKKRVEPWAAGWRYLVQDLGKISGILQIANQSNTILVGQERQGGFARLENQWQADIDRSERDFGFPFFQEAQ